MPGRCHPMDEATIVRQEQQAGCVLVKPTHRLHARRCGTGPLPQRRRQQGVDRGPGARPLRAFIAGRLVKHEVGPLLIEPLHPLHGKAQPLRLNGLARVANRLPPKDHLPLLDQTRTDPARAKSLGKQQVLNLHGPIVAEGAAVQ